jgi:hypothetical protein
VLVLRPVVRLHLTSPVSKKLFKKYNKKFSVDPDVLYQKIRDAYREAFITKKFTFNLQSESEVKLQTKERKAAIVKP